MTFDSTLTDFERANRIRMDAVAEPLSDCHATLFDAIARFSHPSTGRNSVTELDPTVMTIILEARKEEERWYPHAATRGHYWTRVQINHLISIGVPNWCSLQGLARPENTCEQLWLLLDTLNETGLLHFDSDDIDELREPLRCYGQLDEHGRPGTEQPVHLCRCYWPTARQLHLGLEENPPPMPDSFDWYRNERDRAAS